LPLVGPPADPPPPPPRFRQSAAVVAAARVACEKLVRAANPQVGGVEEGGGQGGKGEVGGMGVV
jgi:hypothetical protein